MNIKSIWILVLPVLGVIACSCVQNPGAGDFVRFPYLVDLPVESRSISAENPTGEKGGGSKAPNGVDVGRKARPCLPIAPGKSLELCDIRGPGVIRRIWITQSSNNPVAFRSLVLRAWWDDQAYPSIECPLGDFMGFAHGQVCSYQSAVHSVGQGAALNFWLPMPFAKRARLTVTNELGKQVDLFFYQIEYTIHDPLPADVGRLHVCFRRENPTTPEKDFEILPRREGKGRFVGSVMGIRTLDPKNWWGEGEIEVYLDGDRKFPTICGTGSEDYVGLSWGLQPTPFLYHGCPMLNGVYSTMYRWHLPDPILWKKDIRVTIQQLGRRDDWSAAAFWYEPVPSAPLPPMPDVKARTADITPAQK